MAKNVLKLEDFFGAKRRAAILLSSQLLRSKGKERRMKLSVTMPLSNSDLSQCPAPFLGQFGIMGEAGLRHQPGYDRCRV